MLAVTQNYFADNSPVCSFRHLSLSELAKHLKLGGLNQPVCFYLTPYLKEKLKTLFPYSSYLLSVLFTLIGFTYGVEN